MTKQTATALQGHVPVPRDEQRVQLQVLRGGGAQAKDAEQGRLEQLNEGARLRYEQDDEAATALFYLSL